MVRDEQAAPRQVAVAVDTPFRDRRPRGPGRSHPRIVEPQPVGEVMAITVPEAQARPSSLIEQVNQDQASVEIASTTGTAYLVSEDEYLSWREMAYLLRSPNAERLRQSVVEGRGGWIAP